MLTLERTSNVLQFVQLLVPSVLVEDFSTMPRYTNISAPIVHCIRVHVYLCNIFDFFGPLKIWLYTKKIISSHKYQAGRAEENLRFDYKNQCTQLTTHVCPKTYHVRQVKRLRLSLILYARIRVNFCT